MVVQQGQRQIGPRTSRIHHIIGIDLSAQAVGLRSHRQVVETRGRAEGGSDAKCQGGVALGLGRRRRQHGRQPHRKRLQWIGREQLQRLLAAEQEHVLRASHPAQRQQERWTAHLGRRRRHIHDRRVGQRHVDRRVAQNDDGAAA